MLACSLPHTNFRENFFSSKFYFSSKRKSTTFPKWRLLKAMKIFATLLIRKSGRHFVEVMKIFMKIAQKSWKFSWKYFSDITDSPCANGKNVASVAEISWIFFFVEILFFVEMKVGDNSKVATFKSRENFRDFADPKKSTTFCNFHENFHGNGSEVMKKAVKIFRRFCH